MWLRALTIGGAVWLSACAGTATRLPDVSLPDLRAEAITQEARALSARDAQTERLLRVARPILLANAELCPKTRADIGVLIHSEESYSKEMRMAARRELGARMTPTVYKVAQDSPAERAGVRPGDSILIDGAPVTARGLRKALDDRELADGATTTLRVGRWIDGATRADDLPETAFTVQTACRYPVRLRASSAINAYADGRHITITSGMMEFTRSDDELALIIGHELAHNTMGHIRKVIGNLILSGLATRYTRPFESESDYVGLYYMVRAGYDPTDVEDFWRRLAEVDPRSVNRAKTHPTFPDRYLRLSAARAEIEAKQAAGEALVPNYKHETAGGDETPDA